jgi:hypothetical protein
LTAKRRLEKDSAGVKQVSTLQKQLQTQQQQLASKTKQLETAKTSLAATTDKLKKSRKTNTEAKRRVSSLEAEVQKLNVKKHCGRGGELETKPSPPTETTNHELFEREKFHSGNYKTIAEDALRRSHELAMTNLTRQATPTGRGHFAADPPEKWDTPTLVKVLNEKGFQSYAKYFEEHKRTGIVLTGIDDTGDLKGLPEEDYMLQKAFVSFVKSFRR